MRISDWSSDVCSSDLPVGVDVADDAGLDTHRILQAADGVLPALARTGDELLARGGHRRIAVGRSERLVDVLDVVGDALRLARSEERRVGKEGVSTCGSRWSPDH